MPVGMFDGTHHPRAREDIHTVDAPRVEDIEGDHGFERHEQRQWPRHHPMAWAPPNTMSGQRRIKSAPVVGILNLGQPRIWLTHPR